MSLCFLQINIFKDYVIFSRQILFKESYRWNFYTVYFLFFFLKKLTYFENSKRWTLQQIIDQNLDKCTTFTGPKIKV